MTLNYIFGRKKTRQNICLYSMNIDAFLKTFSILWRDTSLFLHLFVIFVIELYLFDSNRAVLVEILVTMTFFRSICTVDFNAEKSAINIALFIVKVIPYFFVDVSLIIYGS